MKRLLHIFASGVILTALTAMPWIGKGYTLLAAGSSGSNQQLFLQIERSRDADQVHYALNLTHEGILHQENPIRVYWVRCAHDGRQESLTWMQRRYAYDLKILEQSPEHILFHFVSYNKMSFLVKRDVSGQFCMYARTDQGLEQVLGIYVQFVPGTLGIPAVEKVELRTMHTQTGRMIVQTIKP